MRSTSLFPCESKTHSSTFVACAEKSAKFTPLPSHVAPLGYGRPSRTRESLISGAFLGLRLEGGWTHTMGLPHGGTVAPRLRRSAHGREPCERSGDVRRIQEEPARAAFPGPLPPQASRVTERVLALRGRRRGRS